MAEKQYSIERLAQHARDLAERFGVELLEEDRPYELSHCECLQHIKKDAKGRMIGVAKEHFRIRVHFIVRHLGYYIALHELGHVLHPNGMIKPSERTAHDAMDLIRTKALSIHQEECATEWARQYALVWTPEMESAAQPWTE